MLYHHEFFLNCLTKFPKRCKMLQKKKHKNIQKTSEHVSKSMNENENIQFIFSIKAKQTFRENLETSTQEEAK